MRTGAIVTIPPSPTPLIMRAINSIGKEVESPARKLAIANTVIPESTSHIGCLNYDK